MPTPTPDHAAHDRTLIAALSTRDPGLSEAERAQADALRAGCPECARLHDDLVALATALPTTATPARSRDFTLTPADAERLRRTGLRGWLGRVGTSRDVLTRPLAIGFTTLGLAGLLVATAPTLLPASSGASGGASLPAAAAPTSEAALASGAPAESQALTMSAAPSPVDDGEVFNGADSSDGARATTAPAEAGDQPSTEAAIRDDASGLSVLLVLAGSMFIVGLGLFALRWSARRFGS